MDEKSIQLVENYIRNKLINTLIKNQIDTNDYIHFLGHDYIDKADEFEFNIGEQILLKEIVEYVNTVISCQKEITQGLQIFNPDDELNCEIQKFYTDQMQLTISAHKNDKFSTQSSLTHSVLYKLLETADRNITKAKGGYRYTEEIKSFATYIRMLAGRYSYTDLQKNFELCLPSIVSVNRYIYKSNCRVMEGILRCNELLLYLKERKLPLVVNLSEDATRIIGRVQYDIHTNQIVGFVPPISKSNGLPIPFSFKARNTEEIVNHFINGTTPASFVNVIMAQPVTTKNVPSFCLLIFGSDNKYTSEDVSNRWDFIVAELIKINIKVLSVSSDSDPKYNSAMRKNSLIGLNASNNINWFSCAAKFDLQAKPLYIQDTVHIATKLRNFFLKTHNNLKLLPFGDKNFIKIEHLEKLLIFFSKDKHNLCEYTLNPTDRQNFESVLRMCDQRVIDLLRENIVGSTATIKFLEMIRDVITSYMDISLSPLARVNKLWYTTFMIRFWRHYVLKKKI